MPGDDSPQLGEEELSDRLKSKLLKLNLTPPPPRLTVADGRLVKNPHSLTLTLADEILAFAEGEAADLHEEVRLAGRGESEVLTLYSEARKPTKSELTALAERFAITEELVEAACLVQRELLPLQVGLFGYTGSSLFDSHRCSSDAGALELLQTRDLKQFLTAVFGAYRKDLVKATLATTEARFWHAAAAVDSMPLEWLIDYLRGGPEPEDGLTNLSGLQALFSSLKPGDARRVLRHPDPLLEDAVEMFCDYEDAPRLLSEAPKIKSARELHDLLLTLEQGESQCIYPEEPEVEHFGQLLSRALDTPVKVLHSAQEAAAVGSKLHNCAATKHNRVRCQKGELFLLTLHEKAEEPTVLMSFDSELKLLELKRTRNMEDRELEARVKSLLPGLRSKLTPLRG